MPATTPTITVRKKFGSMDRIERIYAFDPSEGTALCQLREWGGKRYLECLQVGDVEAIMDDAVGTYGDVEAELRKRAGEVLPEAY
jgi:hypothetical protein